MKHYEIILLFAALYPRFFDSEPIKALPEGAVFDELMLDLRKFDAHVYEKDLVGVTFGYYGGSVEALQNAVAEVDGDWVQFFQNTENVFCGYADGNIASFCHIDDMGTHKIRGREYKIGGVGCVGTLPEYRNRGIGLTMVKLATRELRDNGFDYSIIHFTSEPRWYEKLGYERVLRWNKHGAV